MQIQPYLFFEGRCEEAIAYYGETLGAELLMLMRYGDSPEPPPPGMVPPGSEAKVMHASFRIGSSTINASDGHCSSTPDFGGFKLSLQAGDAAEAERIFAALADGGAVEMPMTQTFFAPRFGMVRDRFGVSWMVMVAAPMP